MEGKLWPLTKQKNSGEVLSNLLLSAGKRAAHSFDIYKYVTWYSVSEDIHPNFLFVRLWEEILEVGQFY